MGSIVNWLNESRYIRPLSPACKMCARGSKLVVLITGKCPVSCFYCPISYEKGGTDRIFADEWELSSEDDTDKLIREAKLINARGAGVTGGDPLVVWKRVEKYITLLKNNFGSSFHIHLYTSGVKNREHISDLISTGLDEIRFHPPPIHWKDMSKSPISNAIKSSINSNVDVAIEIPVLPDKSDEILLLIKWSNDIGVDWINLNELEFSERNTENLHKKNYWIKNDISAAVKGSEETAYKMLNICSKEDLDIGVHYCSSSFKDGIQLKNRIMRRAKNIKKPYEVITEEGTILKGVIYSTNIPLDSLLKSIKQKYKISYYKIGINSKKNRIDGDPLLFQKIACENENKSISFFLIEEYPTADGLEVERTPLPI